jgi:hypothetical protein
MHGLHPWPNLIILFFSNIIAQPYNKMQSADDSMVYYYSSYEAGFNAFKECIDQCSTSSESESMCSMPSLGDAESTNLNSCVGTLSDDDDISIETYGSIDGEDDARGDFSSNASRSTQYTYYTLEDLSIIYEEGESQCESILTLARRPLKREDTGCSMRHIFSHIQAQRCTSPLGQEITFSDPDNCPEHDSSLEWDLYDCDSKRTEHTTSGSISTDGRFSYFSSDSSINTEGVCFESMQRKLGFNLAHIVLEKYLHLRKSAQPQQQDVRRQAFDLSRHAFEYVYPLRISKAQMNDLEEQRVAARALFQTAQKRLSFQLNILRIRKKVSSSCQSLSQRALGHQHVSPRGSFASPSLGLRRKRLQRELSEKKLRDAFQAFHQSSPLPKALSLANLK